VSGGVTAGGMFELRKAGGAIGAPRLFLYRDENAGGGTDLRIVIGHNAAGQDRLVIGPININQFEEWFIVRNNGDVVVNRNLFLGSTKIPVDVVTGEVLLPDPSASGQYTLTLQSRLATVSDARIMFGISRMFNGGPLVKLGCGLCQRDTANGFKFTVQWDVGQGTLNALSFVVVFVP